MPAILLREVDVELWGSAAVIEPADDMSGGAAADTHHLVAGAALTLSVYLWRAPLLIQYQVGRRFTDDEAISQQVGLGIGL